MQVLSGPIGMPQIHFEAPPSAQVPSEMAQFIAWFNRTAPGAPSLWLRLRGQGSRTFILNPCIRSRMVMDVSGAR